MNKALIHILGKDIANIIQQFLGMNYSEFTNFLINKGIKSPDISNCYKVPDGYYMQMIESDKNIIFPDTIVFDTKNIWFLLLNNQCFILHGNTTNIQNYKIDPPIDFQKANTYSIKKLEKKNL